VRYSLKFFCSAAGNAIKMQLLLFYSSGYKWGVLSFCCFLHIAITRQLGQVYSEVNACEWFLSACLSLFLRDWLLIALKLSKHFSSVIKWNYKKLTICMKSPKKFAERNGSKRKQRK
jgi:hypothetical protein